MSPKNMMASVAALVFFASTFFPGCDSGPEQPAHHKTSTGRVSSPNQNGFTASTKAQLTILLAQYNQEDRVLQAQTIRDRAHAILKTRDIFLVNEPLGLAVYYGRFENEKQAQKEFKHVKKIYAQLRPGPWQFPYIREIPQPDPPAPPAWNILNSPCRFALQIGAYYDIPEENYYDRKQDAVKAVKNLRDTGERAFFFHAPKASFIYVGCFTENDVYIDNNQNQPGRHFSPAILAMKKKYPYHYRLGAIVYDIVYDKNNQKQRIPLPSKVVDIDSLRQP